LIKKQGKEIDLTEEGIILYNYSKELELLHRNLESELKNKSSIHKVYNVGASMTIGGYVLPYILAEYKKAYKNIDIRLQVGNTEEIINKLLNRKIELALIEENLGYTIISKETIKREIKLGVIKIIPIEGLEIYRDFNFLYQKYGNKDFIEDFIKFCYISG
jgi:LysR family transcriptional regulator, transcriptional activator of the cysJI operon